MHASGHLALKIIGVVGDVLVNHEALSPARVFQLQHRPAIANDDGIGRAGQFRGVGGMDHDARRTIEAELDLVAVDRAVVGDGQPGLAVHRGRIPAHLIGEAAVPDRFGELHREVVPAISGLEDIGEG